MRKNINIIFNILKRKINSCQVSDWLMKGGIDDDEDDVDIDSETGDSALFI